MFGAAKSDFEAHAVDCACKQGAEIGGRRVAEVERELRQQCIEKDRLPRLERVTLTAAEKRAPRRLSFIAAPARGDASR